MTARSSGHGRRPPALARRILLARAILFWEDLLTRLWRGASVLILFVGLTLLGLWAWLPGTPHVALLVLFAAAVSALLRRDLRGLEWPGEEAALRRLERDSGFGHRPLLAIEDRYAGDMRDAGSRALFEAHRRRMAERVRAVRVGPPLSRVPLRDRFALRAVPILLLAAGSIAGWSDARDRFAAALAPDFSGPAAQGETGALTLWIAPPSYTGAPPLWLDASEEGGDDAPIRIPEGSELVAQIRGGEETPELAFGDETLPFEPAGPGGFQIAHVLAESGRFAVVQGGRELAARSVEAIGDEPPFVALTDDPSETPRTALRLDVLARDDYGIAAIRGIVRRVGGADDETLELSVPVPQVGLRDVQAPAFYNLMAHPWAGMDVSLVLTAEDAIGQTGRSREYFFALPERYFMHPVARRIDEQRKLFVRDPELGEATALALEELTLDPSAYLDDAGVHLALVAGAKRLLYADEPEAARQAAIDLMWDAALAIEEGPLAFAERRVRDLQERLLEALSQGASEEEIDRLLEELRVAMDDYMRALSNRLRADPGDLFDPTDALKAVGSRELTDLVDQIRELVRTGSTEQARTLLTRLQEIVENISVGNLSDLAGDIGAQAAEVIQTVRQLMADQQALLDETFELLRGDETGAFDTGGEARGQGRIRAVLQTLMERMEAFGFGTVREFSRADRSMGRAVRQLEADRPGQAVDHQTEAIEYLRAGADALMREMLDRAGEDVAGDGRNFFAAPRDPMGRRLGGDGDADTTDFSLPDKGAIVKAREILDELRKRVGEQHRPLDERDYLRRLLRRF